MAVTRLKRKDRRNKARAANRKRRIQQLTRKPVIKKLEEEAGTVVTEAPEVSAESKATPADTKEKPAESKAAVEAATEEETSDSQEEE